MTGTDAGGEADQSHAPDDLDQRLAARLEQMASGFRSVIDKRLGNIERVAQAYPQVQAELSQLRGQLGEIQGYFRQAEDANLEPEERDRRANLRSQQEWVKERQAILLNARQNSAAFKVMKTISDLGYTWNDERLDWSPDLYATDPDGWASAVCANAASRYKRDLEESRNRQVQERQQIETNRQREAQQRQQTEQTNLVRSVQAQVAETPPPSGAQIEWDERVRQMTPGERRAWIARVQDGIRHRRIEKPSDVK